MWVIATRNGFYDGKYRDEGVSFPLKHGDKPYSWMEQIGNHEEEDPDHDTLDSHTMHAKRAGPGRPRKNNS